MARVHVEPQTFSQAWYKEINQELERSKNVTFLFVNCTKGLTELAKVRDALRFKKRMMEANRGVQANQAGVEAHAQKLKENEDFASCKHCDDEQLLAAIFLHPTRFILTGDKRMAKCRAKISGKVKKEYCNFRIVDRRKTYDEHRADILS